MRETISMQIKLFVLDINTWNHLTMRKQVYPGSLKNNGTCKLLPYNVYIYIYMYELTYYLPVFTVNRKKKKNARI